MSPDPTDPKAPKTSFARDEQKVITYAMIGFVYLAFLSGVGMILFGPPEKVNDSRINLVIISPLLIGLGYLTGRRTVQTDTGGGANVAAPGGTINLPPAPAAGTTPEDDDGPKAALTGNGS